MYFFFLKKVDNGKWKFQNGEWKVENGKWKIMISLLR